MKQEELMSQVEFVNDIDITPEIRETVKEYRDKLEGWQKEIADHIGCDNRYCYCGIIKINMAIMDKLISTVEKRIFIEDMKR